MSTGPNAEVRKQESGERKKVHRAWQIIGGVTKPFPSRVDRQIHDLLCNQLLLAARALD